MKIFETKKFLKKSFSKKFIFMKYDIITPDLRYYASMIHRSRSTYKRILLHDEYNTTYIILVQLNASA